MITFMLVRNGRTIAVMEGQSLPAPRSQVIFDGNVYEVVTVKHTFHKVKLSDLPSSEIAYIMHKGTENLPDEFVREVDPPTVHVNHLRIL